MALHPVFLRFARVLLLAALASPQWLAAASAANAFTGRWALTIPNGSAGWLEIKEEKGWYDGDAEDADDLPVVRSKGAGTREQPARFTAGSNDPELELEVDAVCVRLSDLCRYAFSIVRMNEGK